MKKSVIINLILVAICLLIGYYLASSCSIPADRTEDVLNPEQTTLEERRPNTADETVVTNKKTDKNKSDVAPSVKIPSSTHKHDISISGNAKGNRFVKNFAAAKSHLKKIYPNGSLTFYCSCETSGDRLNASGCGLKVSSYANRATKIEWEHVVPASLFGKAIKEWEEGSPICKSGSKVYKGRRCVQKTSEIFNLMEGDLHNLKKESGALNGIRSDNPYAEIPGEKRIFGSCDFEVSGDGIEPPEDKKGDVARTMFYMQSAYPEYVKYDEKTLQMMAIWNKADPVSKEEYELSLQIDKIQGSKNPFVTEQYLGH